MRKFYIDSLNRTANFSFEKNKEISDRIKNSDYNSRWNPELMLWVLPVNKWSKDNILKIVKEYFYLIIV